MKDTKKERLLGRFPNVTLDRSIEINPSEQPFSFFSFISFVALSHSHRNS
jgi:hypothetical protein